MIITDCLLFVSVKAKVHEVVPNDMLDSAIFSNATYVIIATEEYQCVHVFVAPVS